MGGHCGNTQTGTLGKTLGLGQRVGAGGIHRKKLGRRPFGPTEIALEEPDPGPNTPGIDTGTHSGNNARTVKMRDHAVAPHGPPSAVTPLHIERIDARSVNPHKDLPVSGDRRVDFTNFQHVPGWTEFFIPSCAHFVFPRVKRLISDNIVLHRHRERRCPAIGSRRIPAMQG